MAEETIKLSPDAMAFALRKIKQIQDTVGTIGGLLRSERALSTELAENCLKVAEFELSHLSSTLGVETDGYREREQRYAGIREANARAHKFEALLGDAQSPQATQAALNNLEDRLGAWWRKEGFGLVSDVAFGAHACKINFSCSLFGDFRLVDSQTPVSDKERKQLWYESLREQGFVLVEEERNRCQIQDCDASRQALTRLLKARLPSFRIEALTNYRVAKTPDFALRSVEGYLHDIADINSLPARED